ncbi:MAG: hypothetical protein PHO01_13255 [Desulfotomaculaceae bacterium]|nr:hypothetical protein [Desulfotomaculaceae bacterium]
MIRLITTPYKDKTLDRDSYDINKAAKDIAESTLKKESPKK